MEQKLIIETSLKTAQRSGDTDTLIALVGRGVESRTANTLVRLTPAVAAGAAGAISAAGVDGLPAEHGIEVADLIGVSWAAGDRYGLTVDTANANDIEFDNDPVGKGDALPAADTPVVAAKEVDIEFAADGDNVQGLVLLADQACHVRFEESDGTVIQALRLAAGEPYVWLSGAAAGNPLTGNPWAKIVAYNRSAVAATLQATVLYNA